MARRPVDSEIVDERAPWRVKMLLVRHESVTRCRARIGTGQVGRWLSPGSW